VIREPDEVNFKNNLPDKGYPLTMIPMVMRKLNLITGLVFTLSALNCLGGSLQWQAFSTPDTSKRLFDVTYGEGLFVAVGEDMSIFYSSNGSTWSTGRISAAPGVSINSGSDLVGIAYGNGKFLAVNGFTGDDIIADSVDGINWVVRDSDFRQARAIDFQNGKFYATDRFNNGLFTSTNGITWNQILSTIGRGIHSITHGNGFYVIYTLGGSLYRSEDLVTWNGPLAVTRSAEPYSGVVFGNGRFVATHEFRDETIRRSVNGFDWRPTTVRMPRFHEARDVAFGSAGFVICTGYNVTGLGSVIQSSDGITWQPPINFQRDLNAICYAEGVYVAVGDSGSIALGTPRTPIVNRKLNGDFDFIWPTVSGRTYRVQQSTNIASWQTIRTFSASRPAYLYTTSPDGPKRYFRLQTQ